MRIICSNRLVPGLKVCVFDKHNLMELKKEESLCDSINVPRRKAVNKQMVHFNNCTANLLSSIEQREIFQALDEDLRRQETWIQPKCGDLTNWKQSRVN